MLYLTVVSYNPLSYWVWGIYPWITFSRPYFHLMFNIVFPLLPFSSGYDDCILEFIQISLIEMRYFRHWIITSSFGKYKLVQYCWGKLNFIHFREIVLFSTQEVSWISFTSEKSCRYIREALLNNQDLCKIESRYWWYPLTRMNLTCKQAWNMTVMYGLKVNFCRKFSCECCPSTNCLKEYLTNTLPLETKLL